MLSGSFFAKGKKGTKHLKLLGCPMSRWKLGSMGYNPKEYPIYKLLVTVDPITSCPGHPSNSSHLKIDGWKLEDWKTTFLLKKKAYFQGRWLLVLGVKNPKKNETWTWGSVRIVEIQPNLLLKKTMQNMDIRAELTSKKSRLRFAFSKVTLPHIANFPFKMHGSLVISGEKSWICI